MMRNETKKIIPFSKISITPLDNGFIVRAEYFGAPSRKFFCKYAYEASCEVSTMLTKHEQHYEAEEEKAIKQESEEQTKPESETNQIPF